MGVDVTFLAEGDGKLNPILLRCDRSKNKIEKLSFFNNSYKITIVLFLSVFITQITR